MRRSFALSACALAVAAVALSGCKREPQKPLAGLLAAGQPIYLVTKKGKKPLAVGAQLKPGDQIEASGPAVLEYFGGAVRFLDDGDEFEVGDVPEAKVLGASVPAQVLSGGKLKDAPKRQRIIAARYHSVQFTPESAKGGDLSEGDYFKAFFTPNGIANLREKVAAGEGPRKKLPPPPLRKKVPHVHAGDLGQGGARIEVEDEYVVAETDDMATAVLPEGQLYELGRTTRLLLPNGAEATVVLEDGTRVALEGPADISLR